MGGYPPPHTHPLIFPTFPTNHVTTSPSTHSSSSHPPNHDLHPPNHHPSGPNHTHDPPNCILHQLNDLSNQRTTLPPTQLPAPPSQPLSHSPNHLHQSSNHFLTNPRPSTSTHNYQPLSYDVMVGGNPPIHSCYGGKIYGGTPPHNNPSQGDPMLQC